MKDKLSKARKKIQQEIGKYFTDIECNISLAEVFEDNALLTDIKNNKEISRVRGSLVAYRGFNNFDSDLSEIICDFFVADQKLIIIIDEDIKFTALRLESLNNYPKNIKLGFDIADWMQQCRELANTSCEPLYADEKQAYQDSIIDIMMPVYGFKPPIRLKDGKKKTLENILKQYLPTDIRILNDNNDDQDAMAELIGMQVIDEDGNLIGRVSSCEDYGAASPVLFIVSDSDEEILLPLHSNFIAGVDKKTRIITAILPDNI